MTQAVALSIAGSDNSAGAGIQADLKTMSALGTYGLTAVTCVVAEVPGTVSAIQPIEPRIVAEQIRLSFAAFPVAAVKTGMLYSTEIIIAVLDALAAHRGTIPLVVDPVMVATSGDPLLQTDAIELYRTKLLPQATLATPNMDEVRVLLGLEQPPRDFDELKSAGEALVKQFGCAFLMKGGHLKHAQATDFLVTPDGSVATFSAPFIPGVSTHGTGCTMSAAIAASLAHGFSLHDAVSRAKAFVQHAIRQHLSWERAAGETHALHHFASRQ